GSGLAAWGLTSLAFVYLLVQLKINLPILAAIAIYPLAMLAGAASMLPGGIGSVEATIVVVLSLYGVSVGVATLAAIGIRLATIWFSVVCGFIALAILELPFSKRKVS
ncbi:MAG: lysylphosphatidylglycerol synthase domain-containing protein, partial [Rugosibacter sp.]